MNHETSLVTCLLNQHPKKNGLQARVIVAPNIVSTLYKEALKVQQKQIQTHGFDKGEIPLSYLEQLYGAAIFGHMEEFLLTHCVINALCDCMCKNHTFSVSLPQIDNTSIKPELPAEFNFFLQKNNIQEKKKWNTISFQQPSRRNYKDIDKQVETFLATECQLPEGRSSSSQIEPGDWILLSLSLVDAPETKKPLLNHTDHIWLRLGTDEPDYEAIEIFKGKAVGDIFITKHDFFQAYFSEQWNSEYFYQVIIEKRIPGSHIPKEHLSQMFFCNTDKEIKELCVQIFSFRQDLSLRRETVEQLFKTLQKNFTIELPKDLLQEKEVSVLQEVKKTPDYPVYRLKKDFKAKIRLLAEKQLREMIIIDTIAAQEAIRVEDQDLEAYIALHTNPRTRDLVNFKLPQTQIDGQEQPIPANLIRLSCLREKTLNYILKQLTKTA